MSSQNMEMRRKVCESFKIRYGLKGYEPLATPHINSTLEYTNWKLAGRSKGLKMVITLSLLCYANVIAPSEGRWRYNIN